VRILDRYILRETALPFLLSLAIFTFVLAVQPMLDYAEQFLAKGVPLGTVAFLMLLLQPQALGLALPMAFLTGLLMAGGRMSSDRETVALLASGVSPFRLARPAILLAAAVGHLDLYVMVSLVPDSNQKWREVTFRLLAEQGETDIRPGLFYEGFPGKVLYVQSARPGGGWSGVIAADTADPERLGITVAEEGRLQLDHARQEVNLYLHRAFRYSPGAEAGSYEVTQTADDHPLRIAIPAASVFGTGDIGVSRGLREKRIPDLRRDAEAKRAIGESPHNEIMAIHQMFSFPIACLVFAPIGIALGLHTRREGKLAGLTLGLVVIAVYYAILIQAEGWTKGQAFPAAWARWLPNLVLAPLGMLALWARSRTTRTLRLPLPTRLRGLFARRAASADTTQPRTAAPVALVIRFPEFALPRPRLLDLYVCGRYLRLIALTFAALLLLSYLTAFLDRIERLFKDQADLALMAEFLWYSTPEFITYIVPIATLIAVLGTIGGLTRSSELTVMRACGISLYRAALPLVTLAAVWSALLFVLDERVVARSKQRAEALDSIIRGNPPRTVLPVNRSWLADAQGTIYHWVAGSTRPELSLLGLSVFDIDTEPYRLGSHTHATRADHRNGRWIARSGWIQHFPTPTTSRREDFEDRELALPAPADFGSAQIDPATMTYGELHANIERLGGTGFSLAEQRTHLHRKLAFPAVALVMTLLAVPFGVTTGRRGALYGIGLAILLAIGYFLLMAVFMAAGRAAVLPPALAAWAANVFYLAAATYLVLTVRT
jgi:LPS export ABC transporter permease LptG/LPS export ABC transporter permease LptF